jgi:hypothetical protein
MNEEEKAGRISAQMAEALDELEDNEGEVLEEEEEESPLPDKKFVQKIEPDKEVVEHNPAM